jgi:tetratricopeptide (TPR) repeat protein
VPKSVEGNVVKLGGLGGVVVGGLNVAGLEHSTAALCQATDIRLLFPNVASSLGAAYALAGRLAEAVRLCEQAVETGGSMRGMFVPLWVGRLAEAYLLAGRIGDAADAADRALDLSRAPKERGWEAWALRLAGEIHSRRDPLQVKEAEASYRQAMALANELGMRPLEAHCHLGLGKLYRRTGKREQAREHLATATKMYREMGMTSWLEKAEPATTEAR